MTGWHGRVMCCRAFPRREGVVTWLLFCFVVLFCARGVVCAAFCLLPLVRVGKSKLLEEKNVTFH